MSAVTNMWILMNKCQLVSQSFEISGALSYVVLCYFMLPYIALCCLVSSCVVLCRLMPSYVVHRRCFHRCRICRRCCCCCRCWGVYQVWINFCHVLISIYHIYMQHNTKPFQRLPLGGVFQNLWRCLMILPVLLEGISVFIVFIRSTCYSCNSIKIELNSCT